VAEPSAGANRAPGVRPDGGFILSVIVPVYNEERTIAEILRRVEAAPYGKQILVVDDGSTDGTGRVLDELRGRPGYQVLTHERNRGKGSAIRTALPHATGEFTIIQDGDLEYDPRDYPLLVEPLRRGDSDVVYGSRYLNPSNIFPGIRSRLGVRFLNWMVRALYRHPMSDEATCYKAFRTDLLKSLPLRCRRFEFCPEVTAKVIKRGHRIVEVPIRYAFRTGREGKKIRWWDFAEAVACLLRNRLGR
jgi:dolichol-phosphate mannosyltransferase